MSAGAITRRTRAVEAQLVQALDLRPLPLPPELAAAAGTFRGAPVAIRTTAYHGACIRLARFATVVGDGLEIGNILCLAHPAYPLPVLGADLVAARRDSVMLAADLSLLTPDPLERDRQLALLERARRAAPVLPSGGDLPAWAAAWFSPQALYTRIDPRAHLAPALAAFQVFPDTFAALVTSTSARPELQLAVAAAQEEYLAVHRTDDKGLRLLAAMFGPDWATHYLETVLFPAGVEVA